MSNRGSAPPPPSPDASGQAQAAAEGTESPLRHGVEAAHSPGPWTLTRGKRHRMLVNSVPGDWYALAKVVVRMECEDRDHPVGLANARLIAAAPDLLAALRAILPHAEAQDCGGPDIGADLSAARAAIRKATAP